MKNIKQYLFVSFNLIFLSFIMFLVHDLIFGQLENTVYYSLMSLCFIPINILAVTLVFETIMEKRSKTERMNKLNMLVGLFFSDFGFSLLTLIAASDKKIKSLDLDFNDLKTCSDILKVHSHEIDFQKIDYTQFKKLIVDSREILSNLISNENILEHEIFADLLMSLMHLRDEILFVQHMELTKDDAIHLEGDIIRVYKNLSLQWIKYLSHLKQFYPYQYKSSIKFNPFSINDRTIKI